jgi:hypothetical protein
LSERQIASTLSISRKAVRRHLGRNRSKDTKAPPGEAPTGSDDPKDTKAPPGSVDLKSPPAEASRSLCRAYQPAILAKLEQGLTAQRIFQDLRDEQGFTGKYPSVRRYVQRLSERSELAFRRMEVDPGYEMQVDYGTGARCQDSEGNHRFEQIAMHCRQEPGKFSTQGQHLASEKISGVERGAAFLLGKARLLGPHSLRWAETALAEHGVRGMRIIQGLLGLSRNYEASAIEAACDAAWRSRAFRYRTVKELLKRQTATQQVLEFIDAHPVIRPIAEYGEFLKNAIQGG